MLVQNKGEYVRNIGVRLVPGVNRLSDADTKVYLEAVKHPLNKYLVDHGEIKVAGADITSVNANEAVQLINDTYDLKLLDEFQKAESDAKTTRKSVLDAIATQIEAIKNPPKDKIVNPDAAE